MNFEKQPTICIIGLGLIGGSLALALRGFHNAKITGVDTNKASVGAALAAKAIDEAFDVPRDAVKNADIVILCVYPHHIHDIVSQNAQYFKKGAIVCDVCGTKEHLYGGMHQYFPETIDYVGIHPMAGK
ncbi:MAG: prephenate dehydrogenase/arogenate dehydrogenase family protein, partial [Oscillospiraceae bacterium]